MGPIGFEDTEHLSEWVEDADNSFLRSEIRAGIRALEQTLVHYAHDIEAKRAGQLIVHSDSDALVDAAVSTLVPCSESDYLLSKDTRMTDRKLYERLSELIGIFHVQGIKVYFNKADDEDMNPAADLAEAAMIRDVPYLHNKDVWVC